MRLILRIKSIPLMSISWSAIVIVTVLTWSSACLASYRIELKTGRVLKTEEYWEEDNKIHFHYSGGIVSFKKEAIQKIEEYDGLIEQEIIPGKESSEPAPTGNESQAALEKESPTGETNTDKTENKTEDKMLQDFLVLQERSKEIDNMDKMALFELADDLTAWRNKMADDGSGHNYPEQLMEMDVMFDKIEIAIKERGQ